MPDASSIARRPLTDSDLKNMIGQEIQRSVDWLNGELGQDREDALARYFAEPYGDEVEGRSQVVSTDVQDTVESVMPGLMEVFAASDEITRFEPVGPGDEEQAELATDYVKYVWWRDNDGFSIMHDWIKDGLLQKNGIIKVSWDDTPKVSRENARGVNSLVLAELQADNEVEIIEVEERAATEEEMQFAPDGVLYDLTIKRTREDGRVSIVPIPPEDFMIQRRAVDLDSARFKAHRARYTRSDLISMGYDEDIVNKLPTDDADDWNEVEEQRFNDEEWLASDSPLDFASHEVTVYECYINVDFDGDGITEQRMVVVGGPGYEILANEEVDDHPFCSLTPIKMPHKFFGRSLVDLTADIQEIKTILWRNLNDNAYLLNNARTGISNKVDLDDYLNTDPGAAIGVDTEAGDVAGHFHELTTTPLGPSLFPMLEYIDSIRETRTGVTRYNQGLDADSLNKTATGMNQILGQAAKRQMLIARTIAELGVKSAVRKILRLLVNHQDRERMIRLKGKWVPMDPRSWNAEMDVSISVGLGHGTKETQMMADQLMLNVMHQIVALQQGIDGPLVTRKGLHTVLKRFAGNNGYQDPDTVFADPEDPANQPKEQPDKEMLLEQAKVEAEMQKTQMQIAQKDREMQATGELEQRKAEQDAALEQMKARLDAELRQWEADQKIRLAQWETEQKMTLAYMQAGIEREKMEMQVGIEREKAAMAADAERSKVMIQADAEDRRHERQTASEERRSQHERAPAPAPLPPINVHIGGQKKAVKFERDESGNIAGASVDDS